MGGKFHLKLNIGERPIANKYREGKMKSTLERELNSTWNCWKGNDWSQSCLLVSACSASVLPSDGSTSVLARWIRTDWRWHPRVCYSFLLHTLPETEDCSSPSRVALRGRSSLGCWHNGFKRPVLKHGPRSLTYVRVFGCQTRTRNESERRNDPQGAVSTDLDLLWWIWVRAYMLGPERWWTMPE